MSVLSETKKHLGRARYAAAQSLRASWYGAHYLAARRSSSSFTRPGEAPFRPQSGVLDLSELRGAFFTLFAKDRENVEAGLYRAPNDVRLRDLGRTLRSSRAFYADVAQVDGRRVARRGTEVRETQKDRVGKFPAYFRQNFHYQSDGWLSDESARIYDTQVETLFTGSADAMRRAALAELAKRMKGHDQRDYAYLDLACGTGRFLAQVMRSYPKLKAVGLDMSPNYVEHARGLLERWPHVELAQGAGENMPFEDASFDAITSIYLFHELPPKIRPLVFAEIARVLKPGGHFIFADSLQFGDRPSLDAFLEYFPEGFHEPYYKGYLKTDLGAQLTAQGFELETNELAFLTKIQVWKKSEPGL